MKTLLKFVMVYLTFWSATAPALAGNELGAVGDIKTPSQAAEFIYRSSPKESLISVQLLGAVQKPGIYYVPTNTDLLKVLTLAGGSNSNGDISEVLVRKQEPSQWAKVQSKAVDEHRGTYEIDVQDLIKRGGGEVLKLNHEDLIYVPPKEALVSPEASKTVALVSVVMSIALTGLLISKYSNDKQ